MEALEAGVEDAGGRCKSNRYVDLGGLPTGFGPSRRHNNVANMGRPLLHLPRALDSGSSLPLSPVARVVQG